MKKLLFIALVGYGAWSASQHGYLHLPRWAAVDGGGNTVVQLFVGPGCEKGCGEARSVLEEHGAKYEEIYLATAEEGREHDVYGLPLVRVGKREVTGSYTAQIVSALAENYGETYLNEAERRAMRSHFGPDGKPIVVVYGAEWCGYCKRERQTLADRGIPFAWVNVETSPSGKADYDSLHGNGYPVTYVGYRIIKGGYNEAELNAAISELM
jgi:glutaredoxin